MRPRQIGRRPQADTVRRFLAIIMLLTPTWMGWCTELSDRVIILANSDDPESLRIARYYADKRAVPVENIIALPMATNETISWREFVLGIWQPLQDQLVERGWIDGTAMKLFDDVGRRKMAFAGHRISYLVVCRGVPLRINHDPALVTEVNGLSDRNEFKTNHASVDAELSLMAFGPYNINAFVPNPLFRNKAPSQLVEGTVIKVARLDGPSVYDVIGLINGTLEAETQGLIGRAYVDVKGPHKQGEEWMELITKRLEALNYPPEINRASGTFKLGARLDMPALYFGWYASNLNGPFSLPGFRFAPGAIAIHIHSFSAATLRSSTSGWCGPLIARGVAVTTGAVFEPYLQLMHFPHSLLDALAEGMNVGDAAYYALPVLSWQNVLVGDPLYQPFKRSLTEQWGERDQLSTRLRTYLTLREMSRLQSAGLKEDAKSLAERELKEWPSLALGMALAELKHSSGDEMGAATAIGFAPHLKSVGSNDWGLLCSVGDLLAECGHAAEAMQVYANLLAMKEVPDALRVVWLRQATKLASATGNMSQTIAWEHEMTQILGEVKK
jgi:uncharacterized protein (TIGR03790 family)